MLQTPAQPRYAHISTLHGYSETSSIFVAKQMGIPHDDLIHVIETKLMAEDGWKEHLQADTLNASSQAWVRYRMTTSAIFDLLSFFPEGPESQRLGEILGHMEEFEDQITRRVECAIL